jgi:ABC-type Fe3+-hydroxamate transport system substrate-binding protein
MSFSRSISSLLLALVLATACARSDQRARVSDTTRDDFGTVIPAGAKPRRIVSLNPTTTEILFTIGAGDRVVGRTHWDYWPPAALAVPDLGNGIRPNVEAILGVHPDLVLLYGSADNRLAADRLRQAGITTIALKLDHIADFTRITTLIGRLVGNEAAASTLVDSVNKTLTRVASETRPLAKPRVFLQAWSHPVITLGGGSFVSELITIAGGRNIYDSIAAPSAPVAIEDIMRRDPDFVIAGPEAVPQILADPSWQVVRAVRERRVLAYDTNVVFRPSVRLGEGAVSFARLLHPEVH